MRVGWQVTKTAKKLFFLKATDKKNVFKLLFYLPSASFKDH